MEQINKCDCGFKSTGSIKDHNCKETVETTIVDLLESGVSAQDLGLY